VDKIEELGVQKEPAPQPEFDKNLMCILLINYYELEV
jgi:hypothetical protein